MAFCPNAAVVVFNDALDGRQANAGAFKLAGAMQPLERAKQLVLKSHVKTHAVVAHKKYGVATLARLAADVPRAPVYPIWLQGAGRVLPKGKFMPVPMNCTVLVGEPLYWQGDRAKFMEDLRNSLEDLHAQAPPQRWG